MNLFKTVFILLSFSALISCKQVKIVNGEIPAEYLEVAKTYMATYSGSFNSNAGELQLKLDGNKVVATFKGNINDITGNENCESQIGELRSIQVNDAGTALEIASFAFSPNRCFSIEGKTLDLIFSQNSQKRQVSASILQEVRSYQVCQITPPPGSTYICHTDYQSYYMGGIFSKP